MYLCGPTTYAPAHIGHAYSAIAFDTVRRSSSSSAGRFASSVTSPTSTTRSSARERDRPGSARDVGEVRRRLQPRHGAVRRAPADVEPKVSGHVEQIIQLVERLVANGHAYAVDGDVYYEVAKFPPYGLLSGQTIDQLKEGARISVDERKKDPVDFALWKSAKPGEPSWDSPWGKGRPGWHIECSAMTVTHLGTTFDIHAGGKDLIFPHHENEIAQSQGADGDGRLLATGCTTGS